MAKPNLLILMVDQMAGTLLDDQFIDHLHIPNIRKLIDRGVKFDSAYTTSPLCTPARGGFMSGQLPSTNGIYDNAAEFKSTTPTFAHYLRAMGYQTALSGKMHYVGADQLHGFEERLTTDVYPVDFAWTPDWNNPLERIDWWYHNLSSVTDAGIAEISNQLEFDDEVSYCAKYQLYQYARRLDQRPFCLTVSFTHPHDPYLARQQYWDLYDHQNIPMPAVSSMAYADQDPHSKRLYDAVDYTNFEVSDEHIRNARHAYFANISYLDDQIGQILNVLKDCQFDDSTHILLCADHGDMLGERGLWYKMNFFEHSARIPMVLTMAQDTSGRTVKTPVTTHDVLPTLVELVGGNTDDLAAPIDGHSIMSLINGGEQPERSAYAEYCAEGSVAPMVMIRRGDYKYCFCPADPTQLYDLKNDPQELNNLATSKQHQSVLESFEKEMNLRWDFDAFTDQVRLSQTSRRLVDKANRSGRFTSWDYQPEQDAKERFMRNHMDLNVVEANNRFPKT